MNTLGQDEMINVEVQTLYFTGEMLFVVLSDERHIGLPFTKIKWLDWLAKATAEQRNKWQIEPYGYAVWWEELDDGFEIEHALSLRPLRHK